MRVHIVITSRRRHIETGVSLRLILVVARGLRLLEVLSVVGISLTKAGVSVGAPAAGGAARSAAPAAEGAPVSVGAEPSAAVEPVLTVESRARVVEVV